MKNHMTFIELIEEITESEAFYARENGLKPKQLTYDDIDDVKREMLLASAMREYGNHLIEFVTDTPLTETYAEKILVIANTHFDYLEREKLFKDLGKTLLEGALLNIKTKVNKALAISFSKELIDDSKLQEDREEMEIMIATDNASRAADMRAEARGH